MARALSSQNRRAGDFVARYGGEEFVFVWPHCPLRKAKELADRARRAVEKLRIPHKNSEVSPVVTLSGGIATISPTPNCEKKSLIETADKLLYQAKEAGRNQAKGAELASVECV